MEPFLLYIGRNSLYLAVFYAFFLLVMRRTSLFRFNRIMLLAGSAACFVLPLVRLRAAAEAATDAVAAGPLTAVAAAGAAGTAAPQAAAQAAPLLLLYVAGAAAVLAYTLVAALRMIQTIRSGRTISKDGYKLTILDGDIPSFSWGRHIVMSSKDLETNPAILTHERMHVQSLHSLDIAFFSAIAVLHWFNPLVWITFSELKLLHEYEADEGVIENGIDATQYQLLLVKKAVGEHRFSLANGFRHSKLKNRIAMMIKPQTSGWMRLAYGAILPVLAVLMFACNPAREQQDEIDPADLRIETKADDMKAIKYAESLREVVDKLATQNIDAAELKSLRNIADQYEKRARANANEDELRDLSLQFLTKLNEISDKLRESSDKPTTLDDGSVPFQLVEVKPTFNGGDANEFSHWVNSHLKYPEASKAAGEQGRVILQFTVGTDGEVSNVKVLRGVSEALDAEAVRVISASPKWGPGMIEGKPVSVTYTFPVVYQLK